MPETVIVLDRVSKAFGSKVVLHQAELTVERGRGYLSADRTSEEPTIGVIPVDSLFSPVRRVNAKVSNTRVGQDTNYDRLDLEVWTDGTLDGQAAVALAAEMLREQFAPFQLLGRSAQSLESVSTQSV